MKKHFIKFPLLALIFLVTTQFSFAEQGTCSWHGGVSCSAGSDFDGSAVCNDGWRDSSESFNSVQICQANNKCDTSLLLSIKQKYNLDSLYNDSQSKLSQIDYLLNKINTVASDVNKEFAGTGATSGGIQPIIDGRKRDILNQVTALKVEADIIDKRYDIAYNQVYSECISQTANNRQVQLIQTQYTPVYTPVQSYVQQDLCSTLPNTHKDTNGTCACNDGYSKNTTTFQCEKAQIKFTLNLSIGSQNDEVLLLQNKLKSLGLLSATPNGYFGRQTQLAVKAFQKANNINTTGTVGAITRAKLNS